MKKQRIYLILVLILIALSVVLVLDKKSGTMKKKSNEFAVSDTSNITRLFLADKRNNIVKLDKVSGGWRLNDKYTANTDLVNLMLKTLISIDVKSPVSKSARNNLIRLMAAKSVKIEIYQNVYRIDLFDKIKLFPHVKKTKTYYVGDATMNNTGTYMIMEGSEDPYIVHIPGFRGFVATRYSAREMDWRDHGIFNSKLPDIKSVSIDYTETPDISFSISNFDNRNFTLTALNGNKPVAAFDTIKVIEYLGSFRKINYESILTDLGKAQYDSITSLPPTFVITLEDKLGKKQVLKAWRRRASAGELDYDGNPTQWDKDRMFARIEGNNELVFIQFFVFDKLLKPLQWFTDFSQQRQGL